MINYIELYEEAYKNTEKHSPMLFDCGELCSKGCCKENGSGMLLFPGEEYYLYSKEHDFSIVDSNIMFSDYTVKILYCGGSCNRKHRPLSCRIFPLFPFTRADGRITVDFDPRALGTCPLLLKDIDGIYIRGLFRMNILKTAQILIKNPLVKEFLIHMTKELEIYQKFRM